MEDPKAAVEKEKLPNTRQKLEMVSDGEPGFFLSEQEVMQMGQCIWIRGGFIAQLFAFLLCQSAPTALLQAPDTGDVQELQLHL